MKTIAAVMFSACAVLALASGCAVEVPTDEYVASGDDALCENKDGVNAVMTGIAVSAAREMRRWLPYRDFQWNSSTGRLELSANAAPRCPNRSCTNTLALLSLQGAPDNTVKFPGGIYLKASALRAALQQNWTDQNNSGATQEPYDLVYTNWEKGSCDVKYFFNVHQQAQDAANIGTTPRVTDSGALTALNDNLIFLGFPENKMLNFYLRNGQVSIDPTGGLNEGGTTTSGSCTIACTKFSVSNIAGGCCSCLNSSGSYVNGSFARSGTNGYMYLCQ
jgi:hypothetical protein